MRRKINDKTNYSVSRQYRWQQKQKELGRCSVCGELAKKGGLCEKHCESTKEKQKEYMKKYRKTDKWKKYYKEWCEREKKKRWENKKKEIKV